MTIGRRILLTVLAALAVGPGGVPGVAVAADVVRVTSNADPGDGDCATGGCTLREALAVVADGDISTEMDRVEIAFDAALRTRIELTGPLPVVEESLEITSTGRFQPVVALPSTAAPVLAFDPATVAVAVVRGVVLLGGRAGISTGSLVELRVSDATIAGADGPGIGGSGGVVVARSRIADNGGRGVATLGSIALDGTTVAGNGDGGVVSTDALTIRGSTISGNATRGSGGGILLRGARAVSIEDTTVVGNVADDDGDATGGGGGIHQDAFVSPRLRGVVIAGNRAGTVPDDLGASPSRPSPDVAFSFIGAPATGGLVETVAGSNVLEGGDPLLGPLASNGGATPTHLPLTGSPLLDRGGSTRATDQRGARGVQDDPDVPDATAPGATGSDIGAVERDVAVPAAPAPAAPAPAAPVAPAPVAPTPAPVPPVIASPASVPPASGAGASALARFGRRVLVTLAPVGRRATRRAVVRVRLVNGNAFPVTGKLVVRRDARGARGAVRRVRIGARGRTTLTVRLPADARRRLARRGRLAVRLAATVRDPAGTARTVRRRAVVRAAR